jgi:hypothetical protein
MRRTAATPNIGFYVAVIGLSVLLPKVAVFGVSRHCDHRRVARDRWPAGDELFERAGAEMPRNDLVVIQSDLDTGHGRRAVRVERYEVSGRAFIQHLAGTLGAS